MRQNFQATLTFCPCARIAGGMSRVEAAETVGLHETKLPGTLTFNSCARIAGGMSRAEAAVTVGPYETKLPVNTDFLPLCANCRRHVAGGSSGDRRHLLDKASTHLNSQPTCSRIAPAILEGGSRQDCRPL